jgi:hypothetical protein
MKRCPTCQRTYDDDALSFCLEDGSRLVPDESQISSTAPTLIATFQPDNQTAPQQLRETLPGNWNPSNQAWSNQGYQQPQPAPQKRSALPWIVGGIAVLLIGGGILIFALSSRHSSTEVATTSNNSNNNNYTNTNGNANRSVNGNTNANNSNANNSNNSNVNRNANANGNLNTNANGNGNANSNTAPTDNDAVLADLRRLEDKWNKANVDGDKASLSSVLADEYKDTNGDKKQYLARLKPNTNIVSQTISSLDLTLNGNKATLHGINSVRFVKGNPVRYRFTDTYIWRNGRWQATGSVSQQIK